MIINDYYMAIDTKRYRKNMKTVEDIVMYSIYIKINIDNEFKV